MSYEPTKLDGFKKTIKNTDMPDTARKFDNGDRCMAREHAKGKPMFGYYTPNGKGDYTFERTFWKGRAASGYNWCKEQPGFESKQPIKTKRKPTVSKPAPKVIETLDGPVAIKVKPKRKPKVKTDDRIAALETQLAEAHEQLANALHIIEKISQ